MKRILQNCVKIILPLIIGIAIIMYLYRGIDMEDIRRVLSSGVKWYWIILSLPLAVLSHILRGLLWKVQLGSILERPSLNVMVNSVLGNYGVNLILPRFGEIWRCSYVSKRTGLPFTTVIGVMVAERMFDMLSIMLITAFAFVLESNEFITYFSQHPTIMGSLSAFFLSPYFLVLFCLFFGAMFVFRKQIRQSVLFEKLKSLFLKIWQGIKTVKQMKHKEIYFMLIFGIWLMYFLNFYVCLYAFDFSADLGLKAGLILFVMGSIAVVVPVQGGIGPWHFAIISTLMLYGVGEAEASTFALVTHAVQQGFVLILGLYAFAAIAIEKHLSKKEQLTV